MNVKIWWGDREAREGWWIEKDGKVSWIHGPSICKTSGGGPEKALLKAHQDFPDLLEGYVDVTSPEHDTRQGNPCKKCYSFVSQFIKINDKTFEVIRLLTPDVAGSWKQPTFIDYPQLIIELSEALKIVYECGEPTATHLYDEDGVEGYRWEHPDGREWTEIGDHSEKPPMHPVALAVLAKSKEVF